MDTKTLAITLVIALGAQAALGAIVAVFRKDLAVTTWSFGFGGSAVGFSLLLLQGLVHPLITILLANLFVLAFNFALPFGLRFFVGRKPVWPVRFTLYWTLWIALETLLIFAWPSYTLRASLLSVFVVVLILEMVPVIQRSRGAIPVLIRTVMWGLIGCVVLFHASRALFVLLSTSDGMWNDALLTNSTLIFSLVTSFLWFGVLLILDASRLQAETVAHSDELRRLNALKDRVMAMTGHDLRGPMGNLQLLWSELGRRLRDQDYASIDNEILTMVDRSLAGTQSLLDNLFVFAQSQQAPTEGQRETDLALSLLQIRDLWEPVARTKGIQLHVQTQENLSVAAGTGAVEAVFRNLVGNAIKFTPTGGAVHVRASVSKAKTATVEVSDTGIGMPPDLVERAFRLEAKASRPGTAGERGSGFGLVLVKELVEAWHGHLTLESTPGAGTRVKVDLPVSASALQPHRT